MFYNYYGRLAKRPLSEEQKSELDMRLGNGWVLLSNYENEWHVMFNDRDYEFFKKIINPVFTKKTDQDTNLQLSKTIFKQCFFGS